MHNFYTDEDYLLFKVLRAFILSLVISSIGAYIGGYVPTEYYIALIFLQAILICLAFLLRSGGIVGHLFLYTFAFASGITLNPIITRYIGKIGGEVVVLTLFITTLVFIGLGIIGYTRKEPIIDFRAIVSVFFFVMIILMVVVNLFPLDNRTMWVATILGIIIFSGHTIYAFNRIAYNELSDKNIPLLALGLYLSFIYLFLKFLRIVRRYSDDYGSFFD